MDKAADTLVVISNNKIAGHTFVTCYFYKSGNQKKTYGIMDRHTGVAIIIFL